MPIMKRSELALALVFAVFTTAAWLVPPRVPGGGAGASAFQPMIVVVVTGKRMSAEEKRLSAGAE